MLPETLSRQKNKQVYESYDKFILAGSKGYHKQYPRNTFQRNLGNTFYEISRQLGIAATEWSWAALLFDMDNDGYMVMENMAMRFNVIQSGALAPHVASVCCADAARWVN